MQVLAGVVHACSKRTQIIMDKLPVFSDASNQKSSFRLTILYTTFK